MNSISRTLSASVWTLDCQYRDEVRRALILSLTVRSLVVGPNPGGR